jgi:hypothetical protein
VTSSDANGVYYPGDTIHITVFMSQYVSLESEPFITLETGRVDRRAVYVGGDRTMQLHFE